MTKLYRWKDKRNNATLQFEDISMVTAKIFLAALVCNPEEWQLEGTEEIEED